jgi:hypothetical protein
LPISWRHSPFLRAGNNCSISCSLTQKD